QLRGVRRVEMGPGRIHADTRGRGGKPEGARQLGRARLRRDQAHRLPRQRARVGDRGVRLPRQRRGETRERPDAELVELALGAQKIARYFFFRMSSAALAFFTPFAWSPASRFFCASSSRPRALS